MLKVERLSISRGEERGTHHHGCLLLQVMLPYQWFSDRVYDLFLEVRMMETNRNGRYLFGGATSQARSRVLWWSVECLP